MALTKRSFGHEDGREVFLYTLENSKGMKVSVSDFGATLVKMIVPDKDGKADDVILGYDSPEGYKINDGFLGGLIGPSSNRIDDAKFAIDGVEYHLVKNDGENNLHSDRKIAYHGRVWDAEEGENSVKFTLKDADGNMGFPGNKVVSVTYTLSEDNALELKYHGISDRKTILNLTNHVYFNLDGHKSGEITGHILQLNASNYTPVRAGLIPTGEIAPVKGTVMDFTEPKQIGKEIDTDTEQLNLTGGYDHNWVLDGWDGSLREFAILTGPVSGRKMVAYTTLPGVQFYAGNFIDLVYGKDGAVYKKRNGMCLETQYFPNSANIPAFPSCIFGEGREYNSTTVFKFV